MILSPSIPAFLGELAELISSVAAGTTDRLLLCGDLNCPSADRSHFAPELESLFDSFDLIQHISEPTRGSNMLDHLVSESGLHISDVLLDDAGLISDHRLIKARLHINHTRRVADPHGPSRMRKQGTMQAG